MEQITRVLLERLIVNRPHPWGLLITFIELIKNPRLDPSPQLASALGPGVCIRSPVLCCLGDMHTTIQVHYDSSHCPCWVMQIQLLDACLHALCSGNRPPIRVRGTQLHAIARAYARCSSGRKLVYVGQAQNVFCRDKGLLIPLAETLILF